MNTEDIAEMYFAVLWRNKILIILRGDEGKEKWDLVRGVSNKAPDTAYVDKLLLPVLGRVTVDTLKEIKTGTETVLRDIFVDSMLYTCTLSQNHTENPRLRFTDGLDIGEEILSERARLIISLYRQNRL